MSSSLYKIAKLEDDKELKKGYSDTEGNVQGSYTERDLFVLLQRAMAVVADNLFQCIPFEDVFTGPQGDTRKRKRLALLLRSKTSYHETKRPYYRTIQDVFNRPYRLYGVQLKPKKRWLQDLFQLNTIPLRVQEELWRVSALDLTTIDVTEEAKDKPWLPTWAKRGWHSLADKATKDDLQLFVTILKMVIARFAWMIQYHEELDIVEEPRGFLSSESMASYPHRRSMKYVARWNSPDAEGWKKVETKAIDLYRNQDVEVLNGTLKKVNDFATTNPCFVVAANRRDFLSECMKDLDVACAVLAKSRFNKDWPRSIRDWPTSIQTNAGITKRLIQEGTKSVVSHILEKHRLDVDLLTMAMHRFPRLIEHGIMFQSKAYFDIFQHNLDLSKDMEVTFLDGKRLVCISVKTSPKFTITITKRKELSPSRFATVSSVHGVYEYDKKIKLQFDERLEKIIRNVAEKGMVLNVAQHQHRYHQENYWDTWWNLKKHTLDPTTNMRYEEFSNPSDYSAWEFTTLDHLQQLEALGWNMKNAFETALDSFWVSRRIQDRDIPYRGTKVEVIKYLADKYLPGYHPKVRLSRYKEEYRAHVSKELIEVRESLQVGQIWSRGSSKVLIIAIHEKYCTVLYLTGPNISPVLRPIAWFDPAPEKRGLFFQFTYHDTAYYDGSSDWVKVRHQVKTLMQTKHPLEAILTWDTKVTPETYQLCVDLVKHYPKLCLGLTYPRTAALTTSKYTKQLYTLFKDTHDRLVFPTFDYDPNVDYMDIPRWFSFF